MIRLLSALTFIHVSFGRLIVVLLPLYWAFNVAQRGDSFVYALFTYFANLLLLGLIWAAVYWVLNTLLKGLLFGK